ncbi:MAG: NAD-dependent epimerase/dehydratase family protein [Nanoarchaeota archaeon]|nr:NAD-dependent epimerase/dehydratase family protein [Nanoarchaeota archaeon]
MKILITGGAGFIGSHIADLLVSENNEVIIIDNLSSGTRENLNLKAKLYHENLLDFDKIKEIFEKEKPEIVYHLAAQIDIRKSVENPVEDAETNILAAINLLECCVKHKIKHFIFSSTGGAIYGETKEIPTTENTEAMPVSPYGCAKLAIEKYLNYYNKVHNLKYTILRYSNVYGPRQNSEGEAGVISIFLKKMLKNENPIIFGGVQTRDFVYADDVAYANFLALKDNKSDIYNIATGKEIDILEIFTRLNHFFQNKFKPEFQEMKKGEQKRSCLNCEKIKKELGWIPRTNLDEGLRKTYEFMKGRIIK